MGRINVLEPQVFNMIAAGEVVERPSSVVKELVENAIDAGATSVSIEIEDGGKRRIQVSDNGIGILKEDLKKAFLPHATSKLKEIEDLDTLSSLGFRGEALASISSISEVTLISKPKNQQFAAKIALSAGKIIEECDASRSEGTIITVENLFFNTPARLKFIKNGSAEQRAILTMVQSLALANPSVSITLSSENGVIFEQEGGSLSDSIMSVYGVEMLDKLIKIDYEQNGLKIGGFVSKTDYSKPTRSYQVYIVNGRAVESKDISVAVDRAFDGKLVKHNYPVCILDIIVPFDEIDVNVHPRKSEVRFKDKNSVFSVVYHGISKALESDALGDLFSINTSKNVENEQKSGENEQKTAEINAIRDEKQNLQQEKFDTKSLYDLTHTPYKSQPKSFDNSKLNLTFNDGPTGFESSDFDLKSFENDETVRDNYSQNTISKKDGFEENLDNSNVFDGKIVGQIFDTYIIVERDDVCYIIDQHAAQERVLYEKLIKNVGKNVIVQTLLVPYSFKLMGLDAVYFEKIMPSLKNMGFDIEKKFDSYFVYAVPELVVGIDFKKFFGEIFKHTLSDDELKIQDVVNDKLCQRACKSAIKGGMALNREQIETVLETLIDENGNIPEKCPHGRPTVVALSKTDVEKMFKRIV